MPPVNHALAAASVAAVTLAVAAAIAIYESDDVRRVAEDIRRRIAVAFQSIGNEFNHASQQREPLFNRPEDAEGFLLSDTAHGADPGVDADEATRKRQREELMYWNAVRESKLMAEEKAARDAAITAALEYGKSVASGATSSSRNFDDFLRQDEGAAAGTLVFNTGTEVGSREGLTKRRGTTPATYANPFADENDIDMEDIREAATTPSTTGTDMYHVTPRIPSSPASETATPVHHEPMPQLIVMEAEVPSSAASYATATTPRSVSPILAVGVAPSQRSATMSGTAAGDEELADDEYVTAGHDRNAYASIQAWAQGGQPDFYSPLPMSPEAPASEAEVLSAGQLTPTDSASVVDVANDVERASDAEGHDFDIMSESDGIPTPASWSEVGSVVSDSEPAVPT